MNEPIDEQSLQEYLNRGSEFSARYREVDADDVPPELDRAVLAQATSAAKVKPKLQAWRRFSIPVTLAATLVIAVTVLIQPGRKERATAPAMPAETAPAVEEAVKVTELYSPPPPAQASEPSAEPQRARSESLPLEKARLQEAEYQREVARRDTPASNSVAPVAEAQTDRAAAEASIAGTISPVQAASDATSARQAAPAAPAAESDAFRTRAAKTELEEVVVTAQQRTASSGAGPRNTVPTNSDLRALSSRELTAEREADPKLWLQYIRDLRGVGRSIDANREWQRFLRAYPTFPVAETDSARPPAAVTK